MSEAKFYEKQKEWGKPCPRCSRTYWQCTKERLTLSFYRSSKTKDGLAVWCKRCVDIRTEHTRMNARLKKAGLEPITHQPSYVPIQVY